MTRLPIALLLATAALRCAAGVLFAPPQLPTSGWADTEVSTNLVFDAGAAEDNKFTLTISMENAATNNCVEVAFGIDADGDGTLAPEEAELAVSWDCGAWRLRDFRGGTVLQGDGAEATLTLAIDLAGASRLARSMEGNVFAGRAAPTFFNPAWNRAWVTVRGETAAQERIEARATPAGFIVRFR
jgi:hypothetical protein